MGGTLARLLRDTRARAVVLGSLSLKGALALPSLTELVKGQTPSTQGPVGALQRLGGSWGSCSVPAHRLFPLPPTLFPSLSFQKLLSWGLFPQETHPDSLPPAQLCDSDSVPRTGSFAMWLGHRSVALWTSRALHVCDKCPVSSCPVKALMDWLPGAQ